MKIYVGTSGWLYGWNEGGNFEWFVKNSGLNSVELNASFYRFPFPNQIKSWVEKSGKIRFAVKVHRKITHILKLSPSALTVWDEFKALFSPLKEKIDFYLFQLPPSFTPEYLDQTKEFFRSIRDRGNLAIEFRHFAWFDEKMVQEIEKLGMVFVSMDSPQIKSFLVKTNNVVYLRFHGRQAWYNYNYSPKEMKDISEKIYHLKPEYIYAYFNNNHAMLSNARAFYHMLKNK